MSARQASRTLVDNLSITRSSVPSSELCRQCRNSTRIITTRRYVSDKPNRNESFPEVLRRKLWKGTPPGPENIDDVYGGPGVFANMARERQKRREREAQSEDPADTPGERRSKYRTMDSARNERLTDEESIFSPGSGQSSEQESVPEQRPSSTMRTSPESAAAIDETGMKRRIPGTKSTENASLTRTAAEILNMQDSERASKFEAEKQRKVNEKARNMGMDQIQGQQAAKTEETETTSTALDDIRDWDNLPIIGHNGNWREMPINPADSYKP